MNEQIKQLEEDLSRCIKCIEDYECSDHSNIERCFSAIRDLFEIVINQQKEIEELKSKG